MDTDLVERLCVPGEPAWIAHFNAGTKSFYALRHVWRDGKRLLQRLHRLVLELRGASIDGLVGGHTDHLTLDNRYAKLTPLTTAENSRDRRDQAEFVSKEPGVYWHPKTGKWATGPYDPALGTTVYLGVFAEESDAIDAVREWRAKKAARSFLLDFPGGPAILPDVDGA